MADIPIGSTHFNASGSNTLTQVTASPITVYNLSLTQLGGSVGYLQVYGAGTSGITAGTNMTFDVPVISGTAGAGTPSFKADRDINYYPGKQLQGLSYLWAAGSTGTVAHGVNAIIDITYKG